MTFEILFGRPQPGPFVIYWIVHLPSGAIYVGMTNNWRRRSAVHERQLRDGIHSNGPLQLLVAQDGIAALGFEVSWRAPAGWTRGQVRGAEDAAMLAVLRMGRPLLNVLRPAKHPGRAFAIGPGGRWRQPTPQHVQDPVLNLFEPLPHRRR